MKISYSLSWRHVVLYSAFFSFLPFLPQARPIPKELPAVYAGAAGLATAGLGIWVSNKITSEGTPRYTGYLLSLATASGLAAYVYKQAQMYTPAYRYQQASDTIEQAKEAFNALANSNSDIFNTVLLNKTFETDLRTAHLLILGVLREISTQTSYIDLRESCFQLYFSIAQLYYSYADAMCKHLEKKPRLAQVLSDDFAQFKDAAFLGALQQLYAQTAPEQAQTDLKFAETFLGYAYKNITHLLVTYNMPHEILQDIRTQAYTLQTHITLLQGRVRERLQLLYCHETYREIEKTMVNITTHQKLGSLFSRDTSFFNDESKFIDFLQQLYATPIWHQTACNDLEQCHQNALNSLTQLDVLQEASKEYSFYNHIVQLKNQAQEILQRTTPLYYLTKKAHCYFHIQTIIDRLLTHEKLGELLSMTSALTDDALWNWAERKYGTRWYQHAPREAKKIHADLVSYRNDLERVLRYAYGHSYTAPCIELKNNVELLTTRLSTIIQLFKLFEAYERIYKQITDLKNTSRLGYLIDPDSAAIDAPRLLQELRHIFFSAEWPLIKAHEEYTKDRQTLAGLRRQASELYRNALGDEQIGHLIKRCRELEQYSLRMSDRVSDYFSMLESSMALHNERHERTERERQQHEREQQRAQQAAAAAVQQQAPAHAQAAENAYAADGPQESECSVCTNHMAPQGEIAILRCCGERQFLCRACFNAIQREQNRCPFCRHQNPAVRITTYAQFNR